MNTEENWNQINVRHDKAHPGSTATLIHLGQGFRQAEEQGLISTWFFVRKGHHLRWRYKTTVEAATGKEAISDLMNGAQQDGHITNRVEVIYEPETYAFGGEHAMKEAHSLFHSDSKEVISRIAATNRSPLPDGIRPHTNELSLLLCAALARSARLEWYEQGDMWARVSESRTTHSEPPNEFVKPMRKILQSDPTEVFEKRDMTNWLRAFKDTGSRLASLNGTGQLSRGIRAVITHHVIFHWNRMGIPQPTQATLARTATRAILS